MSRIADYVFALRLRMHVKELHRHLRTLSGVDRARVLLQAHAFRIAAAFDEATFLQPQNYRRTELRSLISALEDVILFNEAGGDGARPLLSELASVTALQAQSKLLRSAVQVWIASLAGMYDRSLEERVASIWAHLGGSRDCLQEAHRRASVVPALRSKVTLLDQDFPTCREVCDQRPWIYA